ncbi:MAG: type II toxin-antitoxin system HicB family antitoxin [Candidatus Thermoplasmatota archaeon]|nr:type II toxin-antitoxin system HicB family antitoxin [Candidatus Thermoplasmatota archaeon]
MRCFEDGYTVIVPSLPCCVTYGENVEEAKEMALEAIEMYLESLREHGEEIPNDDDTLEYTQSVQVHA